MFLKQLLTDPDLQLHMGRNPDRPDLVRFRIMQMTEAGLVNISTYQDTNPDIEGEEYINMENEFDHTILVASIARWVNKVLADYMPSTGDEDVTRFTTVYHNETANHIQDDYEVIDYKLVKTGSQHEQPIYRN